RLSGKLAEVESFALKAAVISRIGAPDEVLAGAAHDEQADLIVVGTHGHSGVARFLLGSVANATVRRAPCDVLVVAPGTRLDVVHAWQLPAGSWGATLLGQARFPWSTVRDAVLASAQTQA